MADEATSFPRYITRDIELPLHLPVGEYSEFLRCAIKTGESAIDRLADLLRPGTPADPSQAVFVQRHELRLDRLEEISGNSLLHHRYMNVVKRAEGVRELIANSSEAVSDAKGKVSTVLSQSLGRIEDSVLSLNEMLESASVGAGNRIPLRTQADLAEAIDRTLGTAVDEVRGAADKMREVVRDVDWHSSRVDDS
ncbi:hypothetical protein LTT66_04105 [Nocardia gipuzkoensis]|uniref:hypothetical protein n=1 Tax=Nocardia gipuzkoensis TaxID=2749991 RepID=UPI001E60F32B|nr:hypothetical protein [Nocardia gipuzkoensis]UGT69394.1 hypothetical protein LTT66_04105 [Nocardia gipuzkoensis]